MKILSIVAIAAWVVSGMSKAADETKPVTSQLTASGETEEQAEKVGTPTQTSGKVIGLHNVKLANVADAHVLVKIQTEQGDTDIADLGAASELKSNGFEPHEGQQL